MDLLHIIPDFVYKYIGIAFVFLLLFKKKIPIINKIDVQIKLPEEFMRHFRWLTPLTLIINTIVTIFLYMRIVELSLLIQESKIVATRTQRVGE